MKQSNTGAAKSGLGAPYQHIPDYKAGMVLPDEISVLYLRLSNDDRDKLKQDDSDSIANQDLYCKGWMSNPLLLR